MGYDDDTATSEMGDPKRNDASAEFWERSDRNHLRADVPARIGSYRIAERIAAGGMGIVYRAQQDNPRRPVALKVIRAELANERVLRRFDDEAQILGRLHHPNIAQIYEAGTTATQSGTQPFFAMEYIEGQSLTHYASQHGMDTRRRLELMATICDAVHHAHQKGVIHRDLKPSNILVDRRGEPKVLDFGVARITDSDVSAHTRETDVGQLLGTLPYMSPEQVAADPGALDIRSDVYALGVILYELLSARLPYDVHNKSVADAVRIIGEQEPTLLSHYSRGYRGDVDTIVAKALEKDKNRRYGTASELGEDIRRYLNNEPIVARPAGTLYQFQKFAKRHRAFVTATAVVFIALIVGITATSVAMVRAQRAETQADQERILAERQRQIAESEALRADRTYRFLENLLVSADPSVNKGDSLTVRDILDRSAQRIATEIADEPKTERAIRRTIGNTYQSLGLYANAVEQLRRASELCESVTAERVCLEVRGELARAMIENDELDDAETLIRDAIDAIDRDLGTAHPAHAKHLVNLADLLRLKGDYPDALASAELAVQLRRTHEDTPARLAQALTTLAGVKSAMGNLDEAESLYREALPLIRDARGKADSNLLTAMSNLASMYEKRGEYESAGDLMQQVLDMRRDLLPPGHPHIGNICNNLGFIRRVQSRWDDARALYEEALRIFIGQFGEDHFKVAAARNNLAGLMRDIGDHQAAIDLYGQVLETLKQKFGNQHPHVATTYNNIAVLHHDKREFEGAEHAFAAALAIQQEILDADHPKLAASHYNLAGVYFDQGKYAQAEEAHREALRIREKTFGASHVHTLKSSASIAHVLRETDRQAEAEDRYKDVLSKFRQLQDEEPLAMASAMLGYAELLLDTHRPTDAMPLILKCIAIREQELPNGDWRISRARAFLGMAKHALDESAEAEQILTDALSRLESEIGVHAPENEDILQHLVQLFEASGREEQARTHRDKLADVRAKKSK